MKRLSVLAGIALTLLPLAASAQQKTLYQRIVEQVRDEQAIGAVDDDIVTFIRLTVKEDWDLSDDEIKEVVRGFGLKVCGDKPEEPIGQSSAECTRMTTTINRIAQDQQKVRQLGRTLQSIATGYELPLSDLPSRAMRLSADLQGILNIWSAGTGSIQTTQKISAIRTIAIPGDEVDDFEENVEDIAQELNDLDDEERIAAVWRYSQGVRLIRDDRGPTYPSPPLPDPSDYEETERQYLFKRWDDSDDCDSEENVCLEDKLLQLLGNAQSIPIDPPLTSSETAYLLFPETMLPEKMPDNIIVWVRLDGDSGNDFPLRDVGLQWAVPLEPVMPSMKKTVDDEDQPIPGGNYPPEPERYEREDQDETPMGYMLCTSPGTLRGYLCRPIPPSAEKGCPNPPPNPNGDNISLVTCTDTGSLNLRYTTASADVCREITWKKPEAFDPQTQCKIVFRCSSNCAPGVQAEAETSVKRADGIIEMCLNHTGRFYPISYLAYHELMHAYELCNLPPGYKPYEDTPPNASEEERAKIRMRNTEACCRREGEAYALQCAMMERDGIFEGAGDVNGIPLNAQTCAEASTDFACSSQQGLNGCFTSYSYTQAFAVRMEQVMNRNPQNVPTLCRDAIDPLKMDPRVKALKELTERRDDVCRPDNVTEYKNRIGNNLCYVGQCVEQSIELHRMTPGRRAATVGDMAAPWNDPKTGTPLGNLLTSPVVSDNDFPAYRPYLLVRSLDGALCQSVGLPALTPSVLCLVEANRQLELTRESFVQTTIGLLGQNLEQQQELRDLTDLARGIGMRTGTELYGNYLRESTRSFADIIGMANTLLKQLKNVEFPAEMCPSGPGLPPPSSTGS